MSVEETNDTHEHFNQSLYQWATKRQRVRDCRRVGKEQMIHMNILISQLASGEGTHDTHFRSILKKKSKISNLKKS